MVASPPGPPAKAPEFPRKPSARHGMPEYATKDAVIEAIGTLGHAMDRRFNGVEQRLDGVDQRLDGVDQRLGNLELGQKSLERRQTDLEIGQRSIIAVMNENHAELNRKLELVLATLTQRAP